MILKLIVAIVATEAITEIVTSGAIFARLREKLLGKDKENPRFMGVLFSCGYCFSVWIAITFAYGLRIHSLLGWHYRLEPLVWGIVIHRASNLWHSLQTLIDKLVQALLHRGEKP